jgi:SAM-dependent methyltransferase
VSHPGRATAFEELVDDYDAARPRYPSELFDRLAPAGRVLELGAGTGIATRELARRTQVVATDLGPRMLGRLHALLPQVPCVVARAEQLPFAAASFDLVCGAQMWHWVDVPRAAAEVARVLRVGGRFAVWWNEVDADDQPWWREQQDRLEAGNERYTRSYRRTDHGADLEATGLLHVVDVWQTRWTRALDWPLYERWLRSKSYVQALDDVEAFVAAERASLSAAFPDGRIVEPFRTVLWVLAAT